MNDDASSPPLEEMSRDDIARLVHDLQERNKELRLLHELAAIGAETTLSIEAALQKIIDLIPPAWQYPEDTCGRITVDDLVVQTANFRSTAWRQSSPIVIDGFDTGVVEVFYLAEKPEQDEGPFLREERALVDSLARQIARIIERRRFDRSLRATNLELEANNQQLRATEQQLRANNQQLEATNQQLRTTKDRLSAIVAASPAAIFSLTPEGEVTTWNRAAEAMFGWSADQVVGTHLPIVPPDKQEEFDALRKRVCGGEAFAGVEVSRLRRGGSTITINLSTAPLRDESGQVTGIMTIATDLTERKAMEAKLRDSEARFRAAFDSASIGRALTLPDGRLNRVNGALCEMLGYSSAELEQKSFAAITHPDDVDESRECVRCLLAGGQESYRLEKRYLHRNGTVVWTDVSTTLLRDEHGEPLNFITDIIDITDRKRAEEARHQAESRFRIAQDMSPDGFTILRPVRDASGRVVDFVWVYENAAVARLNGTDPEEVVGKRLLELFPGHRGSPFFGAYQRVAETGEPTTFEEGYSGESMPKQTWLRIVVVPMDGDIAVLAQDITERKQSEEDLLTSNQQLQATEQQLRASNQQLRETERLLRLGRDRLQVVIQTVPIAILIADEHERILQVNRAAEALFGRIDDITDEPLRCGDVIACVHRHESPEGCGHGEACTSCEVYRAIRDGLAGVTVDDLETEIHIENNGTSVRRQILLSAAPLRLGNRPGVILAANDITQMRALHAKMAQSDRLSSMGMLAAGVAHEINNPLSYVLYNLESLTEDLPKLLDDVRTVQARLAEQHDAPSVGETAPLAQTMNPAMLDDILKRFEDALGGTRRIRDIARGLGTFSRVERDKPVPVNLMHVIEVAINMSYNEIKYRARLVKEYGRIPTIMASEGRLSQVFLNLIINATHAIEDGDVDNNEIRVRTWSDDAHVYAEVRDSGSGIAAENMGNLFEPFYSTKEIGRGSGLGLAISKNIIEGYGGDISVESEVGKGTSFILRIPFQKEAEATECKPVADASSTAAKGRILIVDDEDGIRAAVVRMLRRHETVEASSGAVARQLLETDQGFDLILCDMMMPEVSGMDLHQWLLANHPALAERLIFITGGAFTPKAREYLSKVDNLRLEKPFDVANFKKIVNDHVTLASRGRDSV